MCEGGASGMSGAFLYCIYICRKHIYVYMTISPARFGLDIPINIYFPKIYNNGFSRATHATHAFGGCNYE